MSDLDAFWSLDWPRMTLHMLVSRGRPKGWACFGLPACVDRPCLDFLCSTDVCGAWHRSATRIFVYPGLKPGASAWLRLGNFGVSGRAAASPWYPV